MTAPSRRLRHGTVAFTAVLAIAVTTAVGIAFLRTRLDTLAEGLPSTLFDQQRVIARSVTAFEDLALTLRMRSLDPDSVPLTDLRGRVLAAEREVRQLRESFNFDNLVGAAAVHATLSPAIADVRLWAELGAGGLPPNHPVILALADSRIQEATKLARAQLDAAQVRVADLLRGQARELAAFGDGASLAVLVAGLLAISVTLLIHRRSLERRTHEAQLVRAKEAAEEANRAKSRFLANMSHELRTPLNAILGFSEVIRDGLVGGMPSERHRSYADDINAAGRHLLSIINDLLDLAKIEAGRMTLTVEPVDLDDVVASALQTLRGRAEAKSVALLAELDPATPPVLADARALRQILINLVSNAVKFTPGGGSVRVGARLAGGHVEIEVVDTGIGIPADAIDRVLAPFEQVESALSRREEGTGLGLPIAKSLAELQGGTLTLAARPGGGTIARVTLPTASARQGQAASA